jgi:hypothetical protein
MKKRDIPEREPSLGSPVFTASEAAAYLRVVSEATLASWRNRPPRHGAPRYIKAGGRIAYLKQDLDAWLMSMRRVTTSDLIR